MIKKLLLMQISIIFLLNLNAKDEFEDKRNSLLKEIKSQKNNFNENVLKAMADVPRHLFVSKKLHSEAYENRPLPIGYGQTISQPYIVAFMSSIIEPKKNHKVLEIGTGSGYQASILAQIVNTLYSIEIIEPLSKKAKETIKKLNYSNIYLKVGDGYYGWEEHAPYDSIIVTAASSHIPPPLVKQLKAGGKMIIPVGSPFTTQHLILIEKDLNSSTKTTQILPVRFVPLTGKH